MLVVPQGPTLLTCEGEFAAVSLETPGKKDRIGRAIKK